MTERPAEVAAAAGAAAGDVVLEGVGLAKVYQEEDGSELTILDGVDIRVRAGEAIAVIGASGAGKSTLLHLLGCLDRPTRGRVVLQGRSIADLPARQLAALRNRSIGFVFQFHHLLRDFTALENAMMPLLIAGVARRQARERAGGLLESVGLGSRLTHKSSELSGGEQQRVAVARALANRPAVVLADEPSGNLDTHTSAQLHELFFRLRAEQGVSLVLATHNHELAARADRVLEVRDATLHDISPGE